MSHFSPRKLIKRIVKGILNVYYTETYEEFRRNYAIDPSFRFNGIEIKFYGEGQIICGQNSYIGSHSYVQSVLGHKVTIGKNCAISHNVKIYTRSYLADQDFNQLNRLDKCGDVVIGDGVWIGVNAYIGPGVTIGENAVIAANSVVGKDIPANTIAGGAPAHVIKYKSSVE